MLPLLVCIVRGGPLRRGTAATSLGTALVTYSPYPLIAVLTGGSYQFWYQKFGGIERMLGIIQATGYNRPGVPSLLSRVTANLGTFAMTYVLIALGACAAVWLYRNGRARQRWIATWVFGAFLELAFQITKGTIEEQMFYYLVVPSIVAVASTAPLLLGRFGTKRVQAVVVAAIVTIAGFDLITWVGSHTGRDTAMANAVGWMQSHAPADSRVAPLADGIQFLLPDYKLEFNPEAGEVRSEDARGIAHAVRGHELAAGRTGLLGGIPRAVELARNPRPQALLLDGRNRRDGGRVAVARPAPRRRAAGARATRPASADKRGGAHLQGLTRGVAMPNLSLVDRRPSSRR